MPKAVQQQTPVAKTKPLYAVAPWSYRHYPDRCEIEAYVEASGDWETIVEIRQTAFIDAEVTATFIVHVVNDRERMQNLINEMAAALELCIESKGLTWAAEQAVDVCLSRAKQGS